MLHFLELLTSYSIIWLTKVERERETEREKSMEMQAAVNARQ